MAHRWPMFLALIIGLAALYAGTQSHSDPAIYWQTASRWTARVGFPFFIITYAASSMGRLWQNSSTRTIWQNRRWWGLSFAITHTIHLYAIIHAVPLLDPNAPQPPVIILLSSAGAYIMLYAMAFTSSAAAMRKLGKWWRRIHTLGIHWLWLVFTIGYGGRIFDPDTRITGLIGTAIALTALGLRIAVYLKGRRRANA